MFSSRLSPLSILVVACALAVATGAIAGSGPGKTIGEWGSTPLPRTPKIFVGPSSPTTSTAATFWFSARGAKSGYECKLDSGDFTSCSSPKAYSDLAVGVHTFQVVSVNGGVSQHARSPSVVDRAPAARSPCHADDRLRSSERDRFLERALHLLERDRWRDVSLPAQHRELRGVRKSHPLPSAYPRASYVRG